MIRTAQQCINKRKCKTYKKNRKKLIEAQFAEHGRNFCEYCGKWVTRFPTNLPFTLSVDHKKSIKYGGSSKLSNLAICCLECNLKKGCE